MAALRWKSMDISHLSFSPPLSPTYPNFSGHSFCREEEEKEEAAANGESFSVILGRNRSSASQRFCRREKNHGGGAAAFHAAVSRAFSMRKPSPVKEMYRRIHDEDGGDINTPFKPRKKKAKIVAACKRIFGF